jgi:two-component system, chemotaxis family, sensor kinase CheA
MAYTPSYILELTRSAFRQEADELITELDSALLQLEAQPTDSESINRAFRAMHTLKGSGATAGFKEVSTVLHDVEDIFNDARAGRVNMSSQVIDYVLRASDIVRRMTLASPADTAMLLTDGMKVASDLKALVRPATLDVTSIASVPARTKDVELDESRGLWSIRFTPDPTIFQTGNDPFAILREVLSLGHGAVRAVTDRLFAQQEIDPERCYLSWEVQLATEEPQARIRDAFSFVEDESDLRIEPVAAREAWVLPAAAYFEPATIKDFLEEADEDINEIETQVLALEGNAVYGSSLDGLKRTLHNLKGICGLILSDVRRTPPARHPLRAMSELCHAAETFLNSLTLVSEVPLGENVSEALLEAVDWLKLLKRNFGAARDEWPTQLLQKLNTQTECTVSSGSFGPSKSKANSPQITSIAKQCDRVVSAIQAECRPSAPPSSGDWKMLSRALATLGKAATFEGAPGIAAQVGTLVSICESSAQQQPGETSTWDAFRTQYRDLSLGLEGHSVSQSPSIRYKGRTVSIRPSKAPAEVPQASETAATPAAARSVRVDQAKLDQMMRAVGELLVAKNSLPVLAERVRTSASHTASKDIKEVGDRIAHIADDLQDAMRQIRMMPIRSVFQRFPRMIRDLARSENKQVQLIISGDDTELDKTVLELIGDPLVHLVRNAIDHGIELPETRLSLGKPEMGTIGLEVLKEGSHVIIRISDDGRGMDPQKLRAKAVDKGLLTKDEAGALSDRRALDLIFKAGFSTAEKVTDVSGRGVGMDVVQSNVRQLRGTITVTSELGHGSLMSIKLPSTLMVSKGILVQCAADQYVLPIEGIREMVKVVPEQIRGYGALAMTNIRGAICPVFSLATLFGHNPADDVSDVRSGVELNAAIVTTRRGDIAFVVDRLIAEIDVIVKPLSEGLDMMQVFQGATILGDGSIALIVDAAQLDTLIGIDVQQ